MKLLLITALPLSEYNWRAEHRDTIDKHYQNNTR